MQGSQFAVIFSREIPSGSFLVSMPFAVRPLPCHGILRPVLFREDRWFAPPTRPNPSGRQQQLIRLNRDGNLPADHCFRSEYDASTHSFYMEMYGSNIPGSTAP